MDVERLAETLAAGETLPASQLRSLATNRDLIGLGMLAADVRRRLHGGKGTFVRVEVVDISASESEADAVPGWRPGASAPGVDIPVEAGEVRLVGVPASLDEAVGAVRALRAVAAVPLSGFALEDLKELSATGNGQPATDDSTATTGGGTGLRNVLFALREAGLDAVASARVDRIDLDALRAVADAGLAVQAVTLGTPVEGEALLDCLERIRAWQAATGVVRACVPVPVETATDQPTTGYDDMRHVAVARLLLDNVAHIQAHWTRMGAKLSQACLLFGADDIDAVPARDAMPYGPRRAIVEEVRRNLVAASLEPVERDGAHAVRSVVDPTGSPA